MALRFGVRGLTEELLGKQVQEYRGLVLGCQNLENSVTSQLKALISWLQGAGHTQLLDVFYLTSTGFCLSR